MKILLVSGSRTVWKPNVVYDILDEFKYKGFTHLMQGTAKGVDRLARSWAVENVLIPMDRPADWDRYGRRAGPVRNKEMAAEAHEKSNNNCELIVIWDGGSVGTKQMMEHWMKEYPTSPIHIFKVGYTPMPMSWGKRGI